MKRETVEFDIHELKELLQIIKHLHFFATKLEDRLDRDFKEGKKHYYKEG